MKGARDVFFFEIFHSCSPITCTISLFLGVRPTLFRVKYSVVSNETQSIINFNGMPLGRVKLTAWRS